jgi:hypothetical protein
MTVPTLYFLGAMIISEKGCLTHYNSQANMLFEEHQIVLAYMEQV